MKVLFIYPDLNIDVGWQGCYYEGVASLSAILKSKGHKVELAHIYSLEKAEALMEMASAGFDLVAFSSTTPMFPFVHEYSKIIKRRFKEIPLLCGGRHATSAARETLENSYIDYVCVGEGEDFILDFLEYLTGARRVEDVKNLAYKKGAGVVVINELRPLINPLDDLPFPDRTIFDLQHRTAHSASVSAGRGCPFRCAYCSNEYLNKIYGNKYLRFRRPKTLMAEIETILKRYPSIKELLFLDDVFASNRRWLAEFCALYRNTFKLPFKALLHPATITDEVVRTLKEAGCSEVGFGVQSGSDYIRNDIMLRHVSGDRMREAIKILKKYEIKFVVDIIFGVPLEEKSHMLDTIKFCAANRVFAKPHIFYPLPSTRLEQLAKDNRLLKTGVYGEDMHSKTILDYPKVHKMRILFFNRYCNALISVYQTLSYSLINPSLRRGVFRIFDNIFCSDLVICSVITLRSFAIILRSLIRRLLGVKEYNLRRLKARLVRCQLNS